MESGYEISDGAGKAVGGGVVEEDKGVSFLTPVEPSPYPSADRSHRPWPLHPLWVGTSGDDHPGDEVGVMAMFESGSESWVPGRLVDQGYRLSVG